MLCYTSIPKRIVRLLLIRGIKKKIRAPVVIENVDKRCVISEITFMNVNLKCDTVFVNIEQFSICDLIFFEMK